MDEILKFLTEANIYYLATVNGDKPSVRPIGFVMNYEGKITFCTSNVKPMFEQMKKNNNVEITVFNNGETLRMSGKAIFNTTDDTVAKVFTVMPQLKQMYAGHENIMETFYIDEIKAKISTLEGSIRDIEI